MHLHDSCLKVREKVEHKDLHFFIFYARVIKTCVWRVVNFALCALETKLEFISFSVVV